MNTKWLCLAVGWGIFSFIINNSFAAEPKNITYKSKGKSLLSGEYYEYQVHCKDGKTRTITAWDQKKKWCVGDSNKCTNDQLKTAKMACE